MFLFFLIGNENDVIPECPRVNVDFGKDSFQVMFLRRTRKADVFEIEFKPIEDNLDNFEPVALRMYRVCATDRK